MAKNTAKGKGYRKTKAKKPFLTKGEMIGAIIILVVFVIALIFILNDDLLFKVFPDGNLAGSDVKEGDIVAYADNSMKTRFVKIGEAGEIEGFTRTTARSKTNVPTSYTFTPDDETSSVAYVSVGGSAVKASELPNTYRETFGSIGANVEFTDTIEGTIQDKPAYIFAYTHDYYSEGKAETAEPAEGEERASNIFEQSFSAFVDVDGKHTLTLHIICQYDDGDHYIPAEQVEEYVMSYTDCFTLK